MKKALFFVLALSFVLFGCSVSDNSDSSFIELRLPNVAELSKNFSISADALSEVTYTVTLKKSESENSLQTKTGTSGQKIIFEEVDPGEYILSGTATLFNEEIASGSKTFTALPGRNEETLILKENPLPDTIQLSEFNILFTENYILYGTKLAASQFYYLNENEKVYLSNILYSVEFADSADSDAIGVGAVPVCITERGNTENSKVIPVTQKILLQEGTLSAASSTVPQYLNGFVDQSNTSEILTSYGLSCTYAPRTLKQYTYDEQNGFALTDDGNYSFEEFEEPSPTVSYLYKTGNSDFEDFTPEYSEENVALPYAELAQKYTYKAKLNFEPLEYYAVTEESYFTQTNTVEVTVKAWSAGITYGLTPIFPKISDDLLSLFYLLDQDIEYKAVLKNEASAAINDYLTQKINCSLSNSTHSEVYNGIALGGVFTCSVKFTEGANSNTLSFGVGNYTLSSSLAIKVCQTTFASLKTVVSSAQEGDAIYVSGTIPFSETLTISKAISIKTLSGAEFTRAENFTAVMFSFEQQETASLSGTSTNRLVINGAANTDDAKAAAISSMGDLELSYCTIKNAVNSAEYTSSGTDGAGGALYFIAGNLTLSNSTIQDCSAQEGGAIYVAGNSSSSATKLNLITCTFTGNTVTNSASSGGAVFLRDGASVAVTGTLTYSGNQNSSQKSDDFSLYYLGELDLSGSEISGSGSPLAVLMHGNGNGFPSIVLKGTVALTLNGYSSDNNSGIWSGDKSSSTVVGIDGTLYDFIDEGKFIICQN